MKIETQQGLEALNTITEGLWYSSESDRRITPFAWLTDELGDCNLSKILVSCKLISEIDPTRFIRGWQGESSEYFMPPNIEARCHEILEIFQTHLTTTKTYEFKNYGTSASKEASDGLKGSDCFQFITGQTPEKTWIGLTPIYRQPDTCSYGKAVTFRKRSPSQTGSQIKNQLMKFLDNIRPTVINYKPVSSHGIAWIEAETKDEVIEQLLQAARMTEIWEFQDFGKEKWNPSDEEYYAPFDLSSLEQFVAQYLKSPKLYVVGNWSVFRLYLMGQIENGDWLGVSTSTVWT